MYYRLLTLMAYVLLLLRFLLFHSHQVLDQVLVLHGVGLVDQSAHHSVRLKLKAFLLRNFERRVMLQRVVMLAMKL